MVHGSYSTYCNKRCRCELCTEANKLYKAQYSKRNPNKIETYKRRYYEENADKVKNRTAQWRKENPEKRRFSARLHSAKRRALLLGAKTYPSVDAHITNCYGKPCFFCGSPSDTHEHLIPLSRGGDHSEGNIVPACMPCNAHKHNKLLIEFRHKTSMVK